MPRRPVSPSEAEAYELPSLGKGKSRRGSNESDEDEDGLDEEYKLAGGDSDDANFGSALDDERGGRKEEVAEEEEALLNELLPDYEGEVLEEMVGKGTKIEQLIADVSYRCSCNHASMLFHLSKESPAWSHLHPHLLASTQYSLFLTHANKTDRPFLG
jgi:hypothetical protein